MSNEEKAIENGKRAAFGSENVMGVNKREYFAGLAMQGILANPSITGASDDTVVRGAVTMADKLLKELNS